jgi:HAE1 family hydrophobic/amphiphilic exporter-1
MTASSLLGFIPLVVSSGAGSELYRGMGAVQLGGMLLSTLFTLLLVPTVFSLWIDLRDGILALFGKKPPEMRVETGELVHQPEPVQSLDNM